jgi:HAMP domain-containing protein
MEFDWIPKWWGVITTAVAVLATVAMLWLSKTFVRREELKQVENTMADHSNRLANIEDKLESLPTRDEVNALRLEISDVRGDMKGLKESLRQVDHLARLLIEQGLKDK